MGEIYLGKPRQKIIDWCKKHYGPFEGDIFTKLDGTVVKIPYDASKTTLDINAVEDKQNIKQYSFGKSYTEIDDLSTSVAVDHGLDLK